MPLNAGSQVAIDRDVPMRTEDGIELFADVYRPTGDGSHPVLLVRLPYNKATGAIFTYAPPAWYARHGYIVVVQDTRGRYRSQGVFDPLVNEFTDSHTAVEWAARLPGGNGEVGMYGGSYLGWVQLAAAVEQPPSLRACAPAVIGPDGHSWAWRNGAFNLAFALSWTLEVGHHETERAGQADGRRELTQALTNFVCAASYQPIVELPALRFARCAFFHEWASRPSPTDPYWQARSVGNRLNRVDVPALHIGGWYDMFVEGTIRSFTSIQKAGSAQARGRQRLLIGPWFHYPWTRLTGETDFGPEAENPIDELQVRWFDRWLKGIRNGVDEEPPVTLFILGANRWWSGDRFPEPSDRYRLFLTSQGRANTARGDGLLTPDLPGDDPPDVYYYDPLEATASAGGHSCCLSGYTPMGPVDQASLQESPTLLIYDTEILEQDLLVIGEARVALHAATTATDTDFTAKLCDVHPDGRVINLLEGIVRTSFSAPTTRAGEVAFHDIPLGTTAAVIAAGHRVRLEIASSNFPAYDRSHNNGSRDLSGGPGRTVTAIQTVFHDSLRPSHLSLPRICDHR